MKKALFTGHNKFKHLSSFFLSFGDDTAVHELHGRFLEGQGCAAEDSSENNFECEQSIYEEAVRIVEKKASASEYAPELLTLQRNLYCELEGILSGTDDRRHDFLVVIPVAERPLMLRKCVGSLLDQCRLFRYGGMCEGTRGKQFFKKVSLYIIDDSSELSNRSAISKIVEEASEAGLRAHYIGLAEQSEVVKRIPRHLRGKLQRITGEFKGSVPPHKGASVTRNIALIYLRAVLNEMSRAEADQTRGKEKDAGGIQSLVFFLDSDEEFSVRVSCSGGLEDVPFINYFYWMDRIFSTTGAEVLTGKVVGDPPVSPSVMVSTFLDDLLAFFGNLSPDEIDAPCKYHQREPSGEFSPEYHDMVELFGYRGLASPKQYLCPLKGRHTLKDCVIEFSRKSRGFFSGSHPTRMQMYLHRDFLEIAEARTVYTGNYVFTEKGIDYFIPFAHLKLRMAGPVLGRILRQRLGTRFLSANLPLLHKRTIPENHIDEFRPGISRDSEIPDLSVEFYRQFWGDVMLFSIEKLTAAGYPETQFEEAEVAAIVSAVREDLWRLYGEKRTEIDRKLTKIREYLYNDSDSWKDDEELTQAVGHFKHFCSIIEENFGQASQSVKDLSGQVGNEIYTKNIVEAIVCYYSDFSAWDELVNSHF